VSLNSKPIRKVTSSDDESRGSHHCFEWGEKGDPFVRLLGECRRAARHCLKEAHYLGPEDLERLFVGHMRLEFEGFLKAAKAEEDSK
jgi:hypothetical protein